MNPYPLQPVLAYDFDMGLRPLAPMGSHVNPYPLQPVLDYDFDMGLKPLAPMGLSDHT